ncbi:MAG TPA: ABC transporter permease [Mycobacteriales bacterium]|jgi:putative spermidine/putrescine transport system permease protein
MTRLLVRGGLSALALVTGIYLLLPVLVVVPTSFSASSFLKFPPEGLSTRWYQSFVDDPSWMDALSTSARVAVLSSVCSVVLGVLAALGLVRGRFPFRSGVTALVVAPIIVPYVIVGLSVYIAFLRLGLTQTTVGMVLVHTALAVPYVAINVASGLATFDRRLELAAMSLGAGPVATFFRITLPVIAPSVLAGAVFAFITSWDEVVVAIFLSGPDLSTLPVRMWSGVRVQIDPTVAAVSSLSLLATVGVFAGVGAAALARRWVRRHRAPLIVDLQGATS